MKKHLLYIAAAAMTLVSCIDDSITNDASQQPVFSTSELTLAPLLNGQKSPTYKLMVYNRGSKGISIDNISVAGNDDGFFRFNVDGHSGSFFNDVVIRGGDSIYVFVDAVVPDDGTSRSCSLNFTTAGRTQSVTVQAQVISAQVLKSPEVTGAETWSGNYYIDGTARVAAGAVLTLAPGTNLYFTDGTALAIEGTLVSEGIPENPVVMQGDRFDDIVPDVSYEIVAGQWKGIELAANASVNLSYTSVLNGEDLLAMADGSKATLFNTRLHNASGTVLSVNGATVDAVGCEITDAGTNVIYLENAEATLAHCTVSNHYIMAYPVDPIIWFEGDNAFHATNSIIYGLSAEINDYTLDYRPVFFSHCLFRSPGSDDDNFFDCVWDTDPMLSVERMDYILDYRPQEDSPVIGAADPALTPASWTVDYYGTPVGTPAPIGAYR